jgi:hypothetical protein
MNWLEFLATTIKAIAWPTVALVFLYLVRERVGIAFERLIDRATKLTVPGGIELEFAKGLGEARTKEEQLAVEAAMERKPIKVDLLSSRNDDEERFINLAKLSPEAAILDAFKEVEQVLIQGKSNFPGLGIGASASAPNKIHSDLLQIVRDLHGASAIPEEVVEQFRRVRELRNLAAHQTGKSDLPVASALEYRDLCQFLVAAFRVAFSRLAVLVEKGGPVE